MKNNFTISGLIIGVLMLSCNKPALTRLSCCARENAGSTPSVAVALGANISVYQLHGQWTDAQNHSVELNALKGKVQVVAMVFTHCGYACPRIVQDMKAIQDSVPAAVKEEVGYVLVSFDADRDDATRLSWFSRQQELDHHWTLLHGNAGEVRELSMVLNVKYQKLDDGNFSHSNAIFILDKNGNVTQVLEGLEPQTGLAVNTIHRLVKK